MVVNTQASRREPSGPKAGGKDEEDEEEVVVAHSIGEERTVPRYVPGAVLCLNDPGEAGANCECGDLVFLLSDHPLATVKGVWG